MNSQNTHKGDQLSPETEALFADMRSTLVEETQPIEIEEETLVEEPVIVEEETQAPPSPSKNDVPTPDRQSFSNDQVPPRPPNRNPSAAERLRKAPIRVGLLVWSSILIIVGLIMMIAGLSMAASMQVLLVGAFAVAGLVFLSLAVTTAGKGQTPAAGTQPRP